MVRGWLVVGVIVVIALAVGCRETALDTAPKVKPSNIGAPEKWPMGVKTYANGRIYIVKMDVEGETRLWAIDAKVPIAAGTLVKYDAGQKIFYDKGRKRTYDADGTARHTVPSGPMKGGPAPPLRRREVRLDRKTGNVLLYQYRSLALEDYDNLKAGAYVLAS